MRDDGPPRGPLNIGSTGDRRQQGAWPPLIAGYAAACPGGRSGAAPGHPVAELIEAVLDRRLEGAIVCGFAAHPSLVEQVMLEEEMTTRPRGAKSSIESATQGGSVRIVVLLARLGVSPALGAEASVARASRWPRLLEFGTLDADLRLCGRRPLDSRCCPRALVRSGWATRAGQSASSVCRSPRRWSPSSSSTAEAYLSRAYVAFLDHVRAGRVWPRSLSRGMLARRICWPAERSRVSRGHRHRALDEKRRLKCGLLCSGAVGPSGAVGSLGHQAPGAGGASGAGAKRANHEHRTEPAVELPTDARQDTRHG